MLPLTPVACWGGGGVASPGLLPGVGVLWGDLYDPLGRGLVFGAKGEIREGWGGVQRGVDAVRGCGVAILIPLSASLSACAFPFAFLVTSLV